MEDIAREAGSINLEEDTLFKLQNELEQMSVAQPMIYQPLCEVVEVSHFNCKIISGVSLLITFYYWVFYVFRD
jgi:hypothetical protein